MTDVPSHQSEKVGQGDTGPKQWHDGVDTVWRILVVFDERPRISSVMDVVVEVGRERLKRAREVLNEFLHGCTMVCESIVAWYETYDFVE